MVPGSSRLLSDSRSHHCPLSKLVRECEVAQCHNSFKSSVQLYVAWLVAAHEMRRIERANVLVCISADSLAIKVDTNSIPTSCPCGYFDASAGSVWTEPIILYFNATIASTTPDFVEGSYTHKYEKGWNTQFRPGADVSNVRFSNYTSSLHSPKSLERHVSQYTPDHLLTGSSVRTSRQDILYSSLTLSLCPPEKCANLYSGVQLTIIYLYKLVKH